MEKKQVVQILRQVLEQPTIRLTDERREALEIVSNLSEFKNVHLNLPERFWVRNKLKTVFERAIEILEPKARRIVVADFTGVPHHSRCKCGGCVEAMKEYVRELIEDAQEMMFEEAEQDRYAQHQMARQSQIKDEEDEKISNLPFKERGVNDEDAVHSSTCGCDNCTGSGVEDEFTPEESAKLMKAYRAKKGMDSGDWRTRSREDKAIRCDVTKGPLKEFPRDMSIGGIKIERADVVAEGLGIQVVEEDQDL